MSPPEGCATLYCYCSLANYIKLIIPFLKVKVNRILVYLPIYKLCLSKENVFVSAVMEFRLGY